MEKKRTRFESFLDGLVDFWQLNESRCPVKLLDGIRYQQRIVGYKRNFTAEQAGHIIEMLIRIPRSDLVVRGAFAVINGQQYQVAQAQTILDTIPQCTDITLQQPDILLQFDETQTGSGGRL
ncbi:MAG: hypothetical protein IJN67_11745 [Oscillospiraceae bacterium]|nr:hypothetical protein [Oscillospiraceae bacterium]